MTTQEKIDRLHRAQRNVNGHLFYFGYDAVEEPPLLVLAKIESSMSHEPEFIEQLLQALSVCSLKAKQINYREASTDREDLEPYRRYSFGLYHRVVVFRGWPTDPTAGEPKKSPIVKRVGFGVKRSPSTRGGHGG